MSQAELARRIQVSPSAMGMYEQGRREPSIEILVAIARELGVSTDYLLTGSPQSPAEEANLTRTLLNRVAGADARLESRSNRLFSREELAVLFAALLMEP